MHLLGSQTLTVVRRGAGAYVNGVWTPGTPTTLTILGSFQPLGTRDLLRLPEGERVQGQRKLYTTEALQTIELHDQQPDEIVFEGRNWRVHSMDAFDVATASDLAHYKYRLVAVEDDV